MASELERAVTAARCLLRSWGRGRADWLERLAAPLPVALSGDPDADPVRALQALVDIDPLTALVNLGAGAPQRGPRDRAASHSAAPSRAATLAHRPKRQLQPAATRQPGLSAASANRDGARRIVAAEPEPVEPAAAPPGSVGRAAAAAPTMAQSSVARAVLPEPTLPAAANSEPTAAMPPAQRVAAMRRQLRRREMRDDDTNVSRTRTAAQAARPATAGGIDGMPDAAESTDTIERLRRAVRSAASATPPAALPPSSPLPPLRRGAGNEARMRDAGPVRGPHAGNANAAASGDGVAVPTEPVLAETDAVSSAARRTDHAPSLKDELELQLAEAAYRHGVDLT